jgi:hypothetical protein
VSFRGSVNTRPPSRVSLPHARRNFPVLEVLDATADAPGERFDVYVIDYGAYVDL